MERKLGATAAGKLKLESLDLGGKRAFVVIGLAVGIFVTTEFDLVVAPFSVEVAVVVVAERAHRLAHELDVIGVHPFERFKVYLLSIELAPEFLELCPQLVRSSALELERFPGPLAPSNPRNSRSILHDC